MPPSGYLLLNSIVWCSIVICVSRMANKKSHHYKVCVAVEILIGCICTITFVSMLQFGI